MCLQKKEWNSYSTFYYEEEGLFGRVIKNSLEGIFFLKIKLNAFPYFWVLFVSKEDNVLNNFESIK